MSNPTTWHLLGRTAPGELVDARTQAHWAAQFLAAAADSYARHADDDSHTNLGWVDSLRALVGRPLGKRDALHLGLRIEDLTILLMDDSLNPSGALPLADRELGSVRSELSQVAASHLGTGGARGIALRDYDLPEHRVSAGGRFDLSNGAAFLELSRWYANAASELVDLAGRISGAGAVRCWPHHFDLATSMTLDSPTDGVTKTIGVGMTPGDGSYAEPYWYVTPYPYPDDPTLGPLAGGGQWHREGWLGAVLVGEAALDRAAEVETQRDRVRGFLRGAVAACRQVLAP